MARERYCKTCGGWHDLSKPWPDNCRPRWIEGRAPNIIRDEMDPAYSAADGKVYTSKSAMRKSYKPSGNPRGLSFVEVGDEPGPTERPQPKSDPRAVDQSIRNALARYEAGERR